MVLSFLVPYFLFDFLQSVASTVDSDDLLLTRAANSDGGVLAVTNVSGIELDVLVLNWDVSNLNVLNGDGMDDRHNMNSSNSNWGWGGGSGGSWGRGSGGCWGRGSGGCWGGSWGLFNGSITNHAVTFIVSDVGNFMFNTISSNESDNSKSVTV